MTQIDLGRGIASCPHCFDRTPIRRQTVRNPEAMLLFAEMYALDHADCADFKDARLAQLNRRFRKEVRRLHLVKGNRNERSGSRPRV